MLTDEQKEVIAAIKSLGTSNDTSMDKAAILVLNQVMALLCSIANSLEKIANK